MATKFSNAEPAERPFTVALSAAEIIAVSNYHVAQSKRIIKKVGQSATDMMTLRKSASELKLVVKVAKEMSDAHIARAKGLYSLLS